MQEKNDPTFISDRELLKLLQSAKQRDTEAMLKLVEVFKTDILRISKFIYLPEEDAVSEVTLEFLEYVLNAEISEFFNEGEF